MPRVHHTHHNRRPSRPSIQLALRICSSPLRQTMARSDLGGASAERGLGIPQESANNSSRPEPARTTEPQPRSLRAHHHHTAARDNPERQHEREEAVERFGKERRALVLTSVVSLGSRPRAAEDRTAGLSALFSPLAPEGAAARNLEGRGDLSLGVFFFFLLTFNNSRASGRQPTPESGRVGAPCPGESRRCRARSS